MVSTPALYVVVMFHSNPIVPIQSGIAVQLATPISTRMDDVFAFGPLRVFKITENLCPFIVTHRK
jgi:hypothetical protein